MAQANMKAMKDIEVPFLEDKTLLECYEQCVKDLGLAEEKVRELQAKNRTLSAKLSTQQEDTQGALQFLDALENLLLDHGFKVASIDE